MCSRFHIHLNITLDVGDESMANHVVKTFTSVIDIIDYVTYNIYASVKYILIRVSCRFRLEVKV